MSEVQIPKKRSKIFKRIRNLLGARVAYQGKRTQGTEERWQLIRSHLDDQDRSLLDVGCNLGVLTRKAADAGLFAVGIEPGRDEVLAARKSATRADSVAFMHLGLDPSSVRTLPSFDVTLCLSVHHLLVRNFGEEAAWRIVDELVQKTRRKLFFEPASIKAKYGNAPLAFDDLDKDTIIDYNMKNLRSIARDGASVQYLGETPCLGREPFRLMFLVTKWE